jgi:hypothetical protein
MFEPWIQADGALCREHAVFTCNAEVAVAAAKLEQELKLRMRVCNERTANEVHRCSTKVALQNPDWFIYVMRHCCDTQLGSSRNSGICTAEDPSYNKKTDLSVSRKMR